MKGAGMLVVSSRGVNYVIGITIGCSGRNANIFNLQGIVSVASGEIKIHRHTVLVLYIDLLMDESIQ